MVLTNMHVGVKQEVDKTSALELPSFEPEEIDLWLNNAIRRFTKLRYNDFEKHQKRIDDLKPLVMNVDIRMIESDNAALTGVFTLTTTPLANSYVVSAPQSAVWPTDYWFALGERALLFSVATGFALGTFGVTECTIDEYSQHLLDPFSEHIKHYEKAKPLRIFNANDVELVTDGTYSVHTYHLSYLRKPATVDITTDIASGSIEADMVYEVVNADSSYVTYNGNNYYNGSTFMGVSGTSTYTESGISLIHVSCDLPEHTHDEIVKMAASMMLENIEQPRYQTHMNEVNTME